MASSLPLLLMGLCLLSVAQSQLKVFNLRATGLPSDIFGISDAYVKVFSCTASLGMTAVRHNEVNPWWDEVFADFSAKENDVLRLEVHDSDLVFDDLLGVCETQMKQGTHVRECFLEEGGILHYSYNLG